MSLKPDGATPRRFSSSKCTFLGSDVNNNIKPLVSTFFPGILLQLCHHLDKKTNRLLKQCNPNFRKRSNWIKIFSWKFGPLFLIMILKQCVVLISKTVCSFFCNQPYFVERHFRELFCFNALLSNKAKSNHIMACFYFLF